MLHTHRGPWAAASFVACLVVGCACLSRAEPVVVRGALLAPLLGVPVERVRVTDLGGTPIPFQVDEMIGEGEYVCPAGPEPNAWAGNGILDSADELVFMAEDASPVQGGGARGGLDSTGTMVVVGARERARAVRVVADSGVGLSSRRYVEYDPATQSVRAEQYTATFGRERFHFVQAGIRESPGRYLMLTNELRIVIRLRVFWGLVPISYSEDDLVCFVKRYTAGPVRLIRRGDFHLNLGLGVKGCRAAVNQICYPDLVCVPVRVRLPVRFRSFFHEAYIEMTPVINERGAGFAFDVPAAGICLPLDTTRHLDTLVQVLPENTFFRVDNGRRGYGWLLRTTIPLERQSGSGYVFTSPSPRGGIGHCGFRLMLTDLPRGDYSITNWVVFGQDLEDLTVTSRAVIEPTEVSVPRTGGRTTSALGE